MFCCCATGLEPTGNVVGAPARFTVETIGAGKGELEVTVSNPKGASEKVTWIFNTGNATYFCIEITLCIDYCQLILNFLFNSPLGLQFGICFIFHLTLIMPLPDLLFLIWTVVY